MKILQFENEISKENERKQREEKRKLNRNLHFLRDRKTGDQSPPEEMKRKLSASKFSCSNSQPQSESDSSHKDMPQ